GDSSTGAPFAGVRSSGFTPTPVSSVIRPPLALPSDGRRRRCSSALPPCDPIVFLPPPHLPRLPPPPAVAAPPPPSNSAARAAPLLHRRPTPVRPPRLLRRTHLRQPSLVPPVAVDRAPHFLPDAIRT